MREWCWCGSAFYCLSHKRMTEWRTNHRHDSKNDPEPDKQGSQSQAELAYRPPYIDRNTSLIPDVQVRMGFTPNG